MDTTQPRSDDPNQLQTEASREGPLQSQNQPATKGDVGGPAEPMHLTEPVPQPSSTGRDTPANASGKYPEIWL